MATNLAAGPGLQKPDEVYANADTIRIARAGDREDGDIVLVELDVAANAVACIHGSIGAR